jgi:thiol:disulfide interchange protein DsbD
LVFCPQLWGQSSFVEGTEGGIKMHIVAHEPQWTPGQTLKLNLVVDIPSGWHIYGEDPGPLGLPTQVEWALPGQATAQALPWPATENFENSGVQGQGYSGTIVLPYALTVPWDWEPASAVQVRAKLFALLCGPLCIPQEASATLTLAVANAAQSQSTSPIKIELGLSDPIADTLAPIAIGSLGEANPDSKTPETTPTLGAPDPTLAPQDSSKLAASDAGKHARPLDGTMEGQELSPPQPPSYTLKQSLLIGGMSFVGGILLNLMPCVFPVLGIKVMGFMKEAQSDPKQCRLQGLAFTAGVLALFWILAGLLIMLRQGGAALGWGFQLQNPLFIAGLVVLFWAISLALIDLLDLPLGFASNLGAGTPKQGLAGAFFSGALTTLVASPCTGPFLGAALGIALAAPLWVTGFIFTMLGLGVASPYLVLAYNPQWLGYLPKPGLWMELMRKLLAFPLWGSIIWLLWVLEQQTRPGTLPVVLLAMLCIAFGCWLYKICKAHYAGGSWATRITQGLAICIVLLGLYPMYDQLSQPKTHPSDATQATAAMPTVVPFSLPALQSLLEAGQPVWVSVSARWCISCQVNDRAVINTQAFRDALAQKGVTLMKADWTERDADITHYLDALGRSSIPFNALYIPEHDKLILPPLLTLPNVMDALATVPKHERL